MTDYTKFYGFTENPFDIAQAPKFFFPSESHSEALASLQYGITYRKGFILILGEAGIGKTMLIQRLISALDKQVRVIYFPQCEIPFQQMLKEMLIQLKLPTELDTKGAMMHSLYNHLIQCLEHDENVVVIIDEAENIQLDLIEEIRLLANLETSKSKLLQIVLVGQPELSEKLGSDVVRQIKQRIVISCGITPLTEEESMQYIDYRLEIAGSDSSKIFTDDALLLICRSAKGIPLALNTLCSNALSIGSHLHEKIISAHTIRKVRHEKNILTTEKARILADRIRRRLPRKIFFILSALVLLAMALFFGRNYIQPFFNALTPTHYVVPPISKEKDAAPEVKRSLSANYVQRSPGQKVTDSVPESPKITVSPSTAVGKSHTDIRVKIIVVAKQGVSLSSLAFKYYQRADETLIDHILKLNPEITNPNLILINQKIRIPEITESLLIIQYSEGLYKVHLRTFADLKSAGLYRRVVASWAKGIEIVPWKISAGKTWYRVMVGPFGNMHEALRAIEEMKQKGFSIIPSKAEISWINRGSKIRK